MLPPFLNGRAVFAHKHALALAHAFGFKIALAISVVKFLWDLWKEIRAGQHRRAGYTAAVL